LVDTTPVTRALAFSALFNFRDLGGYAGLDGRAVRWRRLFRSDSLHRLGKPDREAFIALGVRTVIDLRRPYEVSRDGRVPYEELAYHHIHPEHAEWHDSAFVDGQTLERWLADRYLDLADTGVTGLGRALGVIAEERSAPVVVHCLAGKDRTGVVCALTLSLLGVADEVIAEDYELSTAASEAFTAYLRTAYPNAPEVPSPYLASPAGAMLLFLTGLRERYGSVEEYVAAAGLTRAQVTAMRHHLLTP
jgi:protein tyrosine/serine phosphatase